MDIVLNTIFNNPNLPKIPIYGFSDDFNRASADTLGVTAEGKPWVIRDAASSTSVWGTTGTGTAKMKSAPTSTHSAVVDALASDGTLTAVLKTFDQASSSNRFGLAFRHQNVDNYFYFETVYPSSSPFRLRKTLAGVSTTVATSTISPSPGDVIEIVLSGTSITAKVNGVTALTATDSSMVNEKYHGMFAFAGSDAEWDSVQFVAA